MSMSARRGEHFEVFNFVSMFTLDVILKCAFSYDTDCQRLGQPWFHSDWLYFFTPSGRQFLKHCRTVHKVAEEIIAKRRKALTSGKMASEEPSQKRRCLDFLDILLTAKDENGEGLTPQEIRDEVDTFLFEGHDTTASAISWTMFSLAEHPDIQATCQAEINELMAGRQSDDILWDDLSRLPYLTMCIKEALRLHSPVPFIQRELTQEMEIDGHVVPAGTIVGVVIYDMHHNPTVWENSMEFQPERFTEENITARNPYAFIPFSAGPRNCIGQNFAMHEIKLVLAKMLHRFTYILDPGHKVEKYEAIVMKSKTGIRMKAIKENLSDLLKPEHDDHFLLRFLRARNFDLKKTELMLRNDFAWRKQIGADTILDDYIIPAAMEKYYPGGVCGQDKEGSLVWIDPVGRSDPKGLMRSLRKQDVMKSKVKVLESMYRRFALLTRDIVIVFDMEHFGMKHLWKPAPKIFPIAYNLIRPILSEDTVKKIQIHGTNYKQALMKHIDADQLPVHWGGTMVDPDGDPFCSSRVCMGGEVPEEYYIQDLTATEGFTEASVGRGSSLQVDVEVALPRSAIRWQFKTDGFDIGFGVYRKTGEGRQKAGEMEAVLPSDRVNSHLVPEDGSVTCSEPGSYVVRFDNTYSWTRSKKILYLIEVLQPDAAFHMPKDSSSDDLLSRGDSTTVENPL
nr:hypothetical protein BaRGS_007779 [Batillaria attramentaria]